MNSIWLLYPGKSSGTKSKLKEESMFKFTRKSKPSCDVMRHSWVQNGILFLWEVRFNSDGTAIQHLYENGIEIGKPIQLANWK
jgi:hypothetical protein